MKSETIAIVETKNYIYTYISFENRVDIEIKSIGLVITICDN